MAIKTLLLVDDDPDDHEIFNFALQEVNPSINCYAAMDGKDAFQKLGRQKLLPDMIFLDLNMPGMSGIEFLKQIKKDKDLKNIPVIIYTTSSDPKGKEETKTLGAYKFITKPSGFSDLCKILETIVNPPLSHTNGIGN